MFETIDKVDNKRRGRPVSIPNADILEALNKTNCNGEDAGKLLGICRERVRQLILSRKIKFKKTAYIDKK